MPDVLFGPRRLLITRMTTVHRPVMAAECLRELQVDLGSVVVDGTTGGGGHSRLIADAIGPNGRLVAIDRDPQMLRRAKDRLGRDAADVIWHAGPYVDLPGVLETAGLGRVDAILVDLGLSSDQLLDRERGFGFQAGGLLDLRFDPGVGIPARDWLKAVSDDDVANALAAYGDIPVGSDVSRAVVASRTRLSTTEELVGCVEAVGGSGRTHPATVVLQALRIAVNDELQLVEHAVTDVFPRCLKSGGRLVVLTFHSGEDRIVKKAMADKAVWTVRQKKPILPRPAEVRENPRSRSAKLRVAVRTLR